MGGDLHTENSRKLTDKEEAYISANPELYIERIYYEDLNNPNPNPKKHRPYKLEDLPPEKHIKAGYCDEPGLHYVPLDIYPKRTHILRFGPEDILFDPTKSPEAKRRHYDTSILEKDKIRYLTELHKYGFLEIFPTLPPKHINLSALYDFYSPDTQMGKSIQKRISKLKSKERKPMKTPRELDV